MPKNKKKVNGFPLEKKVLKTHLTLMINKNISDLFLLLQRNILLLTLSLITSPILKVFLLWVHLESQINQFFHLTSLISFN